MYFAKLTQFEPPMNFELLMNFEPLMYLEPLMYYKPPTEGEPVFHALKRARRLIEDWSDIYPDLSARRRRSHLGSEFCRFAGAGIRYSFRSFSGIR